MSGRYEGDGIARGVLGHNDGVPTTDAAIEQRGALRGTLRMPGDKSVSHRALILAALADGTSRVEGLSAGLDVGCTRAIVEALGARVTESDGAVLIVGGQLQRAGARARRRELGHGHPAARRTAGRTAVPERPAG